MVRSLAIIFAAHDWRCKSQCFIASVYIIAASVYNIELECIQTIIVTDKPNRTLFIFVTLSITNNTHYNDASNYYVLPFPLRRLVPDRVNTYRPGLERVEDEVVPFGKNV